MADLMTDEEILAEFRKAKEKRYNVARPKFTLKKELIRLVSGILILVLVICTAKNSIGNAVIYGAVISALIILFLILETKNILLTVIFLYQKFAPRFIRSACLFQPSCSEYMRLSILKYGVLKGAARDLRKG